jgi:hypothetical protein
MKYLCRLENIRTSRHEAIIVFDYLEIGTKIGWGADEHSPDGIAYWTVTHCDTCQA